MKIVAAIGEPLSIDLKHSDYIVYADESGDHGLQSIDEGYPVFVLSFCVFEKKYYSNVVTPALRMLKFSNFGHDLFILHEQDIRKKTGAFNLLNKEPRETFLQDLTTLIAEMDFILISAVIDKYKIKKSDLTSIHIYHLAMLIALEKLYQFLQSCGQDDRLTHIVFEARGRTEDAALELEFRRVCNKNNASQKEYPFKILIADKRTNSEGLQFADMVARPVGLSIFRPNQRNRAIEILEKKFYRHPTRGRDGHGLILYP